MNIHKVCYALGKLRCAEGNEATHLVEKYMNPGLGLAGQVNPYGVPATFKRRRRRKYLALINDSMV
jgi:hypothetical protein